MRALSTVAALLFVGLPSLAAAQRLATPRDQIALDSPDGQRLLLTAHATTDFLALSGTMVTQTRQSYCGVASAVSVLNALPIRAPTNPGWEPYHAFTEATFFNDCSARVLGAQEVLRGGMTLAQLSGLLQCHTVRAEPFYAGEATLQGFRAAMARNLAHAGDFVIANYDRTTLGQEGWGHISPLGAYNETSDRVLVMDVARYKYPPLWVRTPALFAAMSTTDPVSGGKTRGWVVVTPTRRAPAPSPVKAPNMILRMAALIAGVSFVLGAALGGTVVSLRHRRRAKRQGPAGAWA